MIEYFSAISISEMDFLETLNPLYAFPIIAVIVCMFIVYTFGFKSSVQPPSFDRIVDDTKVAKKRKSKEASKKDLGKATQNGKVNNSKPKSPGKKKEEKLTEKAPVEKAAVEKKASKKKGNPESKAISENKKSVPNEEIPEDDGWVQLVSKKARKNKKEEATLNENAKNIKNAMKKSTDATADSKENVLEKSPEKKRVPNRDENSDPKEKLIIPLEVNLSKDITVCQDIDLNAHVIPETEKIENIKNTFHEVSSAKVKADEKSSNKSKKKKKNAEVKAILDPELQMKVNEPEVVITEPVQLPLAVESLAEKEAPILLNDNVKENLAKESKPSNVAFDEMEGLYPQVKDSKKKKKVRREH